MSSTRIALLDGTSHDFRSTDFSLSPRVIAQALAHINRFNGHAGAYSVAQHCVQVAALLPPELKLSGLMHDAHEAIMGDMSSPQKKMHKTFADMEDAYLSTIDARFNVQTRHQLVRDADLRLLVTEAKSFGLDVAIDGVEPLPTTIKRWSPKVAAESWLAQFYAYKGRY